MSVDARRKAAAERAKACSGSRRRVPGGNAPAGAARLTGPVPLRQMRAELVARDGKEFYRVDGYASVVERGYPMWDMFGEYDEVIDAKAFDLTLAASPDVAFLTNHKGVTMARTKNGTLELSADSLGLRSTAWLNPDRQDVQLLMSAISDRLVDEMSFAFMLEEGEWNDDFTEFRITQVNIDRGDVSAVNYGANPYTSIAARSREVLRDLDHLPVGAQRAALRQLEKRLAAVVIVDTGDGDEDEDEAGEDVACLKCGALNEDDAKFCDQCGAAMPATDENQGADQSAAQQQNAAPARSEVRNGTGISVELAEALFGTDD